LNSFNGILAAAGHSGWPDWHLVVMVLGMMLFAAVVGGWLAQMLHLPRVTAYLVVGLTLGPSVLDRIHEDQLQYLIPLERLAMALVLFGMGCHFTFAHFRRIIRRVLRLSFGELTLTFVLVTGGMFALPYVVPAEWLGFPITLTMAAMFGALALATAPATTILVLKENDSEGPVTEYATALVALNNLAAILLFEILLIAVHSTGGTLSTSIGREVWLLARDILGSVLLGMGAGLVISYGCGLTSKSSWLVLLLAIATLTLGANEAFGTNYLLTFLAMGATVANAAAEPREITGELDHTTKLLCVIFFVIHGADLNVQMLFSAGAIGAGYIVLRLTGKYFGIYLTAGCPHEDPAVRPWLGATLLAQAGAAIALSSILADPERGIGVAGEQIKSIILGTVVFFEIIGPIMARTALIKAGEVPLRQAIYHRTTSPWEQLYLLVNRIMVAFGYQPWHGKSPDELTIGQLMYRNPKSIAAAAHFDEVVSFIEHSRDNVFPVTSGDELIGIIRYVQLRDALFDEEVHELVYAADLAVPCSIVVKSEDHITATWNYFRSSPDDVIPVVNNDEEKRLVGLIKRRDLFRLFSKFRDGDGPGLEG